MKILSIGTHLFSSQWRDLGHTVCVVADYKLPAHPDNKNFDFFNKPHKCEAAISSLCDSFCPDVVFQGDRSTPLIHCGLENSPIPKVWYAIDTHLHYAWHRHYAAVFDTVFLAQKNMLPQVLRYAPHSLWLPAFSQVSPTVAPWPERTIDVSFVGTMNPTTNPDRVVFFKSLEKNGVSVQVTTGSFVPVYTKTRVVVNQSVADDLNLRFFEAAACGAFLITDRLSWPVNDILEEGVDFIAYEHNNAVDCTEKIKWALGHPREAETMAQRAHDKIIVHHLVQHRAKTVLHELSRLAGNKSQRPVGDPLFQKAHLAWTNYYCSLLALPPPISGFFAEQSEILALQARESIEGRHWALLAAAGNAVNKRNFPRARSLLTQLSLPPKDNDFRINYYSLQVQLCFLEGKREEANGALALARKEFPDSKEFHYREVQK